MEDAHANQHQGWNKRMTETTNTKAKYNRFILALQIIALFFATIISYAVIKFFPPAGYIFLCVYIVSAYAIIAKNIIVLMIIDLIITSWVLLVLFGNKGAFKFVLSDYMMSILFFTPVILSIFIFIYKVKKLKKEKAQ